MRQTGLRHKEVATDLGRIYPQATVEEAELTGSKFEGRGGKEYPPICRSWHPNASGNLLRYLSIQDKKSGLDLQCH